MLFSKIRYPQEFKALTQACGEALVRGWSHVPSDAKGMIDIKDVHAKLRKLDAASPKATWMNAKGRCEQGLVEWLHTPNQGDPSLAIYNMFNTCWKEIDA